MILIPGNPIYHETLANLQFYSAINNHVTVTKPGTGGLPESVSVEVFKEYVLGGEYDERLDEIENDDDYGQFWGME